MAGREKIKALDGLGPYEKKKIRSALRLVWQRSHSRRLVLKRCTGEDGFYYCEICLNKTPALKVDHITACGDLDDGLIERMFCPSSKLQGLCVFCHRAKTKMERLNKG